MYKVRPLVLWFQVCPGKCNENKACVQCTAFQSGELSQEYCEANCTHVDVVTDVDGSEYNNILLVLIYHLFD